MTMGIKNKKLNPGDLVRLNSKSRYMPTDDYYDPLRDFRGFLLMVLDCDRKLSVNVLSPNGVASIPKQFLTVVSKARQGKK
jgi:hypothetical protein